MRLDLEFLVTKDLSSRYVLRNRRKTTKYILKILSGDPLLIGFSSPVPSDQRTRLNAAMVLHRLSFPPQRSSIPGFTTRLHWQTDRLTSGTGRWLQHFTEEAGWGTCIKKSVVTKTTSEENYWQMKLLFDKQFKQEEYLAEGFRRTVLDSWLTRFLPWSEFVDFLGTLQGLCIFPWWEKYSIFVKLSVNAIGGCFLKNYRYK